MLFLLIVYVLQLAHTFRVKVLKHETEICFFFICTATAFPWLKQQRYSQSTERKPRLEG